MPRRINGSKASSIKIGNLSIFNRIGRCEVARSRFGVSVFTLQGQKSIELHIKVPPHNWIHLPESQYRL